MATFYIDPNGSDSANGSIGTPWRTLGYACSHVSTAGDIIHANIGTYPTIASSCTLALGVSIEGANKTTTIFNTTVGGVPTIYAHSSDAQGANGNQHISGITLKAPTEGGAHTGILFQGRNNIKVYDCILSNFQVTGIGVYSNETRDTEGPPSYPNRLPDPSILSWTFNNEVHHCDVRNCGYYTGGNEGCLSLIGQNGILVHDNVFIADGFSGYHGDAIKGVSGFFRNCKFYNNTIRNVWYSGIPWDFAIEFWNYYELNEFYNNIIEGGLDIVLSTRNGAAYSVWVHDNSISQPSWHDGSRGVYIEYENADIIVEKNTFTHLHYPIYSQQGQTRPQPVSNVRVNHNIMTDVGYGYIITEEIDYGALDDTYTNIQFYNNDVVAHGTGDGGMAMGGAYRLINCEIKNNIFQNFNNGLKFKGTLGEGADYLYIQNNIFYNCSTQILWQGLTPTHYTNSGNQTGNPSFVSSTDFHLQSGSIAIGAGVTVTPLLQANTTDKDGITIGTPPEIGAYEYGGTPAYTYATVSTTAITSITGTTASSGGNVTNGGNSTVTARGVVWSTSVDPTVGLSTKTSDGTGTGVFTSSITGLTAATTYYVRAYATNTAGTAYGANVIFATTGGVTLPVLTTTAITAITGTTATSGGNITSAGGGTITARGVCWATSTGPVVSGFHTSDSTGTGSFASSITGLTQNTLYYVRAYATNSAGIAYGNEILFTTTSTATKPVMGVTTNVTSITTTTATTGGTCTSDGGSTLLYTGICISTTVNPPTTSGPTIDSTVPTVGSYVINLTGLTPGTTYYIRAYAENALGTTYASNTIIFSTTALSTPILTTTSVSSITQTTASSGGTISSDGGSAVTVRGVVWGTSTGPTIALSTKTSNGTGIGAFTSSITGLSGNTTYYLRSYATNSVGTAYGNEILFASGAVVPVIIIENYSHIVSPSLTVVSNVTSNGGATVTARGVCYSTSPNPTVAGTHTTDGGGSGQYTSTILGLSPNTTYYLRSYATNSIGTSYSAQATDVTDDISPTYLTISSIHHYETPGILTPGEYGILYNWFVGSDAKNIASIGAHMPTNTELLTLIYYVEPGAIDASNIVGRDLREVGTTYWNDAVGTNIYGFNFRGVGFREGGYGPASDGLFFGRKEVSHLWTATEVSVYTLAGCHLALLVSSSTSAWFYDPAHPSPSSWQLKQQGKGIRLLMDSTVLTNGQTGTYVGNDGKIYPTICIGTQEWTSINLSETKFRDGSLIPIITDNTAWGTATTSGMCYYDNDISNV